MADSDDPGRRRRLRTRFGVAAGAVVLVGAGVAVAAPWNAGDSAAGADDEPAPTTARVERADLSNSRTLDGTLGYGTAVTVKGARSGTVTWLAGTGATVSRGQPLYRADDEPVPVFYGAVPLYRQLSAVNTVGRDVRMVADNLTALGFGVGAQPAPGRTVTVAVPSGGAATPGPSVTPSAPPAVDRPARPARVRVKKGDGVLTAAMVRAVKRWQSARGVPATGVIEVGDVAVLPGPVRIDGINAQVGDPVAAPLLKVTPTTKAVSVPVEATESNGIKAGDPVTVALPDGSTAAAKVAGIGTAVQAAEGEGNNEPQKLTVTVTFADPGAVARFDSARVQVEFLAETRKGVLAVPVTALLALREGGYGVQSADGRLVAVKVGLFAKGMVEVSGAGLAEGAEVVTTS